jgi:hypothetical protein
MSLKMLAAELARHGRNGDTMLAHITPKEAALLKGLGGSGTINPATGLPEYFGLSDLNPFKFAEKQVSNIGQILSNPGEGIQNLAKSLVAAPGNVLAELGALPGQAAGALGLPGFKNYLDDRLTPNDTAKSFAPAIMAAAMGYVDPTMFGATAGSSAANAGAAWAGANAAADPSRPWQALMQGAQVGGAMNTGAGFSPQAGGIPTAPPVEGGMQQVKGYLPPEHTFMDDTGKLLQAPSTTPAPEMTAWQRLQQAAGGAYDYTKNKAGAAADWAMKNPGKAAVGAAGLAALMDGGQQPIQGPSEPYQYSNYAYNRKQYNDYDPTSSKQKRYVEHEFVRGEPGAYAGYAGGGTVEQMSDSSAMGGNTMYPQANIQTSALAVPFQRPQATNMIAPAGGITVDSMTGEPSSSGTKLSGGGGFANGGIAALAGGGGEGHLGDYSDAGGRMLRGPGDGVSDDIPATIDGKRPARLARNEFVIPARAVSELGNGSSEAGAEKLYAMLNRIQKARGKTVGKNAIAKNTRAESLLPA